MMKPVIFFDWDGTLCDSMQLCIEENRSTLADMGLPAQPEEVLRRCNGPTFEEAAPMLGIPADRMDEYCHVRLTNALTLVPKVNRLFPGAKEMLLTLREHADLCIVSNATEAYLSLCMQQFDLQGIFRAVAYSRPGRTKTQNLAALLAEMHPARAIMVGDRLGDLTAGRDNGLPTVAAAFGFGNDAEYAVADLRADSMADLQRLLLDFAAGGAADAP